MDKVAVVILNWNGVEHLKLFLPFVIENRENAKIYIADNGSSDHSIAFVNECYPDTVTLILLNRNVGFSEGYNLALAQIQAEYFILLNSDVQVTPGWIKNTIRFLDSNPKVGACQPKIKSFQNNLLFEYAGAAGGYIDKFGFPFCRGRIFDHVEADLGQYDDNREIFWATGACLFIRSEVYWLAGGLDNDFFAHMEEIDLCWRIQNLGFKIYYFGGSTIYHIGGGTLNTTNPKKTFLNFRNGLSLLYKNLPSNKLFLTIFIRMCFDGIAALKFLISSPKHFWAVIQAHYFFYKNLSGLNQKREKLLKNNNNEGGSNIYNSSIVLDFYLLGSRTFSDLRWKNIKETPEILHQKITQD